MTPNLAEQAKRVVTLACAKNVWLVTAESCTAGSLATLLADVPGAGETFHGGFVVYSKACKRTVLGVPEFLLEKYTTVSREVAEAMATGALKACEADIALPLRALRGRSRTKMEIPLVWLTSLAQREPDSDVTSDCSPEIQIGQEIGDVCWRRL